MIEILLTEEFEKRYRKLPSAIRIRARKQQAIFSENPFHPSLNTEKLIPRAKEVWSFRIDKKYRILFRFVDGNTVLFLTVGPHDWIYKIRF
jgi:mRNA-degrading endonuclease RelE of RelBE toxin-antitoxin system